LNTNDTILQLHWTITAGLFFTEFYELVTLITLTISESLDDTASHS